MSRSRKAGPDVSFDADLAELWDWPATATPKRKTTAPISTMGRTRSDPRIVGYDVLNDLCAVMTPPR